MNVKSVCERLGMTRQNYYSKRRRRQRRAVDAEKVVGMVLGKRRKSPRLGTRKLHYLLADDFIRDGLHIGRDRLLEIMRENDMLVRRKRGRIHTTNSRHNLPLFGNRAKDLVLTGPNQLWVADITYIRTMEGMMYLSLITDAYSRKVVGSHLGDNLETEGCLNALEMALSDLPEESFPMHHSDRGCQYASHLYVNRLTECGLPISMTEQNHCYENALAERMNGIFKDEYEMDRSFVTKAQARNAFAQAGETYNTERPHLSLNYKFPSEIHAMKQKGGAIR